MGQDQDTCRVEPPASKRPPKMSRCGRLRDTGSGRLPEVRPQGANSRWLLHSLNLRTNASANPKRFI